MVSSQEGEGRLRSALADRYLIESEIGEGGMATVYMAQDLKHDRKVAVKVLKPELAAVVGTERFLAEIRTTANLSHPHILPLFDSGEADGFLFYVMPLVEGDSLRERLDRDGKLSVEEALRIAGHVADALDSAHRDGVIHRDLKPANILFQKGAPVVADFGIALAVSAAGEGRLTETGLSLGTPYYMSPEQATGDQTPTAASDVYSLGCVLYEMLTGDPPHTGSSAQAILGKILLGDVTRPTKLRRTIPTNVEAAILRALERLPADRFASTGDLAAALRDKGFRHGVGAVVVGGPWKGLAIGATVVAGVAIIAGVTGLLSPESPPPPVLRQEIRPLTHVPLAGGWARFNALAPDGSSKVFRDTVGLESGWQLWVKERGSLESRSLSGTTNALDVAYSPDGQRIVFNVGRTLMTRSIQGAGATRLLEGVDGDWMAIDWTEDGSIYCEQPGGTLVRVSEDGSAPPDTLIVLGEDSPIWMDVLPGNQAALVVRCVSFSCTGGTYLDVVDFQADTTWTLMEEVLRAWYVPTGQMVWVDRDGAVLATPFDPERLEVTGGHTPLFSGVSTTSSIAGMVMGEDGTAAYVEGAGTFGNLQPMWVSRAGEEQGPVVDLVGGLIAPALSPDGSQLALRVTDEEGVEVWIAHVDRGSVHRLTFGGGGYPNWSPDGRSVTFHSLRRAMGYELWNKRADGSAEAELLLEFGRNLTDAVWSPDSLMVLRTSTAEAGNGDLLLWQVGSDEEPTDLVATEFRERTPVLSPNGRFLAYNSNESGVDQVYVRPFPNVDEWKQPVSIDVGIEPVWGRDGRELFYRKGVDGALVAVEVETEGAFRIGRETILFPAGQYLASGQHQNYDVSPDGQRFVMLRKMEAAGLAREPRLIMIQNFFTELQERPRGRD
jgi:serine/threonine-protein kinase